MATGADTEGGVLAGKVVLVTGGAERVGRTLVEQLAAAGAMVAVNHLGQPDLADGTVATVVAAGGSAFAVEADVSDPGQAGALVDAVVERAGALDVLVHNASNFVGGPFLEVSPEEFDRSFGVNLRGPFFLSQAAARVMVPRGSGRIIALGGDYWHESWPEYVAHSVAKSGLVRLMQVLAVTLSPEVQCIAVCPAKIMGTDDGANDSLYAGRGYRTADGLLEVGRDVRLRTGGADEVAELVVYLSHCSPYLTGTVVTLDGGKSAF